MAAQARALLLLAACFFFFFVMSRHFAAAVSFSYDFSKQGVLNSAGLKYIGDADSSAAGDRILLTKVSNWSTGLVAYPQPVRLWDHRTGKAASFSTSFSFAINSNSSTRGDGMAFFVRPFPASQPPDSSGAFFGLFSHPGQPDSSPPAVGVEFDTFWNTDWDPADIRDRDHIGIDVKAIHSVNYTKDLTNGVLSGTMSANVTYDAASKLLVVTLGLANGSTHAVQAQVDFKDAGLPQDAAVGFSATTGDLVQSNELLSWSFSSTDPSGNKIQLWVIVLLSVASALLAASVAALLWGIMRRQRRRGPISVDIPTHIHLPVARKFTYKELSAATSHFSDDMWLGAGQFGEVYKGELPDPLMPPVAVKKLKRQKEEQEWKRTRKDYVTEITTLGRLSHRNLVRLVGWCHGGGNSELLLVYELVTNKTLDEHLHGSERLLTWPERYMIVRGVGSAIEYLHTSYQQNPILHRDIKPSNVMLDDDFVAKLGDFGLVRQVDPGQGSSLGGTVMIGTRVYMDPVCMSTNTVSTASDMYSFGVLLLEIATGLKPAEVQGPGGLLSNTLINAVQESYAKGEVLQMADDRLNGDFDKREMERVLVVGLLCVQQQRRDRPEVRTAVNLLSDVNHPVPQILS